MADKDDDQTPKKTPAASGGRSIGFAQGSKDRMKLASYHASLIFGSFRADQANDPDIYVTAITHLLAQYPPSVGARMSDPKNGLAGKSKFLPTVSEVREEAERLVEEDARPARRSASIQAQLRERDQYEREGKRESAEKRAEVVERVKNQLRAKGFKFPGDEQRFPRETPATVQAKLGLTPEQFAALPDAPPAGAFNKLVGEHAAKDRRNPAIIRAEEESDWRDHMDGR